MEKELRVRNYKLGESSEFVFHIIFFERKVQLVFGTDFGNKFVSVYVCQNYSNLL
jgi:hypothetical protein